MKLTEKQKEDHIKKLMPMINKVAHSFYHNFKGIPHLEGNVIEDFIQEGVVGLLEGLNRYKSDRGTKVSTFCYIFIFSKIQSYVALNYGVCRQPHKKITNEYSSTDLDEMQEETIAHHDNSAEQYYSSELYHILEILKEDEVTKLEREVILKEYGLSQGELPNNIKPLRKFLLRTGLNKVKKLYSKYSKEK